MADIEVRPDEARAATARVTAAAEGIASTGAVFRAAGAEVVYAMRCASVRSALSEVVEDIVGVPAETSEAFRKLAQIGESAVDRAVEADQWGAKLLGAVPLPVEAP
ncbi:hypothetical protein ACFQ9V_01915 [Leifsonia sp. NPDC056665]|uniref:hypothetical protein n=1 Tax=Leifsonia sp. NPDC056665 TaxID=3345901 RepID=UPI0036CC8528